jgi:kynurenine formamidase
MKPVNCPPLSARQFQEIYNSCKNWGKWGANDERGALNYLTADQIKAAAKLVRSGLTVTLSAPLATATALDNPKPVLHHMTMLPDVDLGMGDLRFAGDFFGMEFHGDAHSHIDALCHVLYQGKMHNGIPASTIDSAGAKKMTMDVAKEGIVGRGVLLDIPRLRKVSWVEPGEAVMADELRAAEEAQGVRLQQGDLLFFRTGHYRRRMELGPWDAANSKAGLHATAMPLLYERRIAAFGADGDGEAVPSHCEGVPYPIHTVGMNAIGLHFMDSLQFEDLARACEAQKRWEFMVVVAPLRLTAGTGSPVNPIAIF